MAEIKRKKQKSTGVIVKDAIMTGISYMIPVIVGGGVITAIAKMMGGYNIGADAANMETLAQVIFTIGNNLFNFAVPCLAAFIAYAIADKPGIAPGYAMGVLAGTMKTGFVGGLVGALLAGWFVLQMKKIKVPKALQGIMPIMFIPVITTLVVGLVMWYIIGVPIAALMGIITGWLTALNSGSRFLLGAVIGAMIAFDNGGPINKTAALFVNGLNADGFFIPTSAKMCAGMTSPLGIAIATFLGGKKKFTDSEREQAKSLVILSCCYVQEGVIPFQLKDPVRLTACICIGGAVTGGLCMALGLESPAVHGGLFSVAMTSNPLLFIGLWLLGGCITGVLYAIVKKPLPEDYVDDDMDNPLLG
ncbi:PTS fructose transporter subunit IIC [Ruminococcus sp. 5_1_39BFAA]|uniref:PTS fructose transporter subunit IIC n=1 Tax=Ruminococcus sp. 5_1_39BFAA TaxID=457412 RepID=UPI00356552A6